MIKIFLFIFIFFSKNSFSYDPLLSKDHFYMDRVDEALDFFQIDREDYSVMSTREFEELYKMKLANPEVVEDGNIFELNFIDRKKAPKYYDMLHFLISNRSYFIFGDFDIEWDNLLRDHTVLEYLNHFWVPFERVIRRKYFKSDSVFFEALDKGASSANFSARTYLQYYNIFLNIRSKITSKAQADAFISLITLSYKMNKVLPMSFYEKILTIKSESDNRFLIEMLEILRREVIDRESKRSTNQIFKRVNTLFSLDLTEKYSENVLEQFFKDRSKLMKGFIYFSDVLYIFDLLIQEYEMEKLKNNQTFFENYKLYRSVMESSNLFTYLDGRTNLTRETISNFLIDNPNTDTMNFSKRLFFLKAVFDQSKSSSISWSTTRELLKITDDSFFTSDNLKLLIEADDRFHIYKITSPYINTRGCSNLMKRISR